MHPYKILYGTVGLHFLVNSLILKKIQLKTMVFQF